MLFKEVLISLRKEQKLNQTELAEKLGLARSTIAGYEQGKRFPRLEDLENIADYFNVDMDYLLGKSSVKRKIDFTELEEKYELDACLGKMSARASEIEIEILKKIEELSEEQKEKLLYFLQTIKKE